MLTFRYGITDGDQIRLELVTSRPMASAAITAPLLEGGVHGSRLVIKVCRATQLSSSSTHTLSWLEAATSFYVELSILSLCKRTKLALSGMHTMQPVWNQELMLELKRGDERRDLAVRVFSAQGQRLERGVHQSSIGQLIQVGSLLRCLKPTEQWVALTDSEGQVYKLQYILLLTVRYGN